MILIVQQCSRKHPTQKYKTTLQKKGKGGYAAASTFMPTKSMYNAIIKEFGRQLREGL